MRFGLERSRNGIYDRIVLELARGLSVHGHDCTLVDPKEVRSIAQLERLYDGCDWIIVTNNSCWMSQMVGGVFLFEALPVRTLFLHHDAISHGTLDLGEITAKIESLVRVRHRSIHFSIEQGDVEALRGLGIPCHPIAHINTLGRMQAPSVQRPLRPNVSFIGHAVPPQNAMFTFGIDDRACHESFLARSSDFTYDIRADFSALLAAQPDESLSNAARLARRVQYLQCCNYYTMFLRGSVLQSLKDWPVDLYGGDPAWIHGAAQTRKFSDLHVTHHSPVFDGDEVGCIFSESAVNLNITSLQFDSGLINRVIDCTASGGFMLTDRKAQLSELTVCADLIGYSTAEELFEKTAYYIDPAHAAERTDIVQQLQTDFGRECSVERCVERMVGVLNEEMRSTSL